MRAQASGREVRNLVEQPNNVNNPEQEDQRDAKNTDAGSAAYWQAACAALPPMTAEEIAAVAVVLRRVNARRTANPSDTIR